MKNKQDTVTISLETYKQMEDEIKSLRVQVKRKTIYKNVIPPVYAYVIMVFVLIFLGYIKTI